MWPSLESLLTFGIATTISIVLSATSAIYQLWYIADSTVVDYGAHEVAMANKEWYYQKTYDFTDTPKKRSNSRNGGTDETLNLYWKTFSPHDASKRRHTGQVPRLDYQAPAHSRLSIQLESISAQVRDEADQNLDTPTDILIRVQNYRLDTGSKTRHGFAKLQQQYLSLNNDNGVFWSTTWVSE